MRAPQWGAAVESQPKRVLTEALILEAFRVVAESSLQRHPLERLHPPPKINPARREK